MGSFTYSMACPTIRVARLEGQRDRRALSRGLSKVRGNGQKRGQGQCVTGLRTHYADHIYSSVELSLATKHCAFLSQFGAIG